MASSHKMLPVEITLGIIRCSDRYDFAAWIIVARRFTKPAIQACYQDLYVGNGVALERLAILTQGVPGGGSDAAIHCHSKLVHTVNDAAIESSLPLQNTSAVPVRTSHAVETSHAVLSLIARPGRLALRVEELSLSPGVALDLGLSAAAGRALWSVKVLTLLVDLTPLRNNHGDMPEVVSLRDYAPRVRHLTVRFDEYCRLGRLAASDLISNCENLEIINVDLQSHYRKYWNSSNVRDIMQVRQVKSQYYWMVRLFVHECLKAILPRLRTIHLITPAESDWIPRKVCEDVMRQKRIRSVDVTYSRPMLGH